MYIKFIVLAALVKLLEATESPLLCAGIYGVLAFLFAGIASTNISATLITALVAFGLSFMYFWSLKKTRHTFWWWFILIGGLIIGLV